MAKKRSTGLVAAIFGETPRDASARKVLTTRRAANKETKRYIAAPDRDIKGGDWERMANTQNASRKAKYRHKKKYGLL